MVNTNYNPSSAGANPFQFSSGPAGAISSALFNLVSVETALEKANLDYSIANTKLSTVMGQTAEQFNIESGKDQANATICQAVQAGAGAGLTLASAGITYGVNVSDTADLSAAKATLNQAETVRTKLGSPQSSSGNIESTKAQVNETPEYKAARARLEELKTANYNTTSGIGSFTKSAAQEEYNKLDPNKQMTIEQLDEKTVELLKAQTETNNCEAVRKNLDDFIDVQTKRVNTLQQQISTRSQDWVQYKDIANQSANAIATGTQSGYQAKQGVAQGAAAMAQTTGSLASSMLGTTNSANNSAAQAIGQILNVLSSVSRAYSA